MTVEDLRNQIRTARLEAGLTQEQAAELAQVSVDALKHLETRRYSFHLTEIPALARILETVGLDPLPILQQFYTSEIRRQLYPSA